MLTIGQKKLVRPKFDQKLNQLLAMFFSLLPTDLKDVHISFAGHKCETCGTYDESAECCHCDRQHLCNSCLNYTYEGPACGKCFDKWLEDEVSSS